MSEWISVDDHMPENDESIEIYKDTHMEMTSVLACGYAYENGEKPYVREINRILFKPTGIEYIDKGVEVMGAWHWSRCFKRVTHWMRLPEPPNA